MGQKSGRLLARRLLLAPLVKPNKLIGVRLLKVRGRCVPVLLFRNRSGSVAARLVLGKEDQPILDGPTPAAVLSVIEDALESLLLARSFQPT